MLTYADAHRGNRRGPVQSVLLWQGLLPRLKSDCTQAPVSLRNSGNTPGRSRHKAGSNVMGGSTKSLSS